MGVANSAAVKDMSDQWILDKVMVRYEFQVCNRPLIQAFARFSRGKQHDLCVMIIVRCGKREEFEKPPSPITLWRLKASVTGNSRCRPQLSTASVSLFRSMPQGWRLCGLETRIAYEGDRRIESVYCEPAVFHDCSAVCGMHPAIKVPILALLATTMISVEPVTFKEFHH